VRKQHMRRMGNERKRDENEDEWEEKKRA